MGSKKFDYEYDYAYLTQDTEELNSAHIGLRVGAEKMELYITPQSDPVIERSLSVILEDLQRNQFDKIKLNILEEGEVYIDNTQNAGSLKKVILKPNTFEIEEIVEA